MPAMPEGARDGILKGMYRLQRGGERRRRSCGRSCSAAARSCNEVIKAQEILETKYDVAADVWSVTSYQRALPRRPRLRALEHAAPGRDAARAVRHAVPEGRAGRARRRVRLREGPAGRDRPLAAAAAALARHRRLRPQRGSRRRCASSSRWTRASSPLATLAALVQDGKLERKVVAQAIKDLGINPRRRIRRS